MRVGVISDTHGLLRPEVVEALRGCERIVHAGDVGKESVFDQLTDMASLVAVRGNVDRDPWTQRLPITETVTWNRVCIHVIHDVQDLPPDAERHGWRVVISGHSHQANVVEKGGVIYLNPGSVGPRRFRLPVAMAFLHLAGAGQVRVETLEFPC